MAFRTTQQRDEISKKWANKNKQAKELLGLEPGERRPRILPRTSQTKHAQIEQLSNKNKIVERKRLLDELMSDVVCLPTEELRAKYARPRVQRVPARRVPPKTHYRVFTNHEYRLIGQLRWG